MASSSATSIRTPCATCDSKGIGVFKCEGCSQVFCRKHVIEHRDILSHQLDEIVLEYDTLQQTVAENNDRISRHPLLQEIDQWERDSIEKIRQTANEAREQLNTLMNSTAEPVLKNLHELAQQLRKAREDDDYVETDLRLWTHKLEQLKSDMIGMYPPVGFHEDKTKVLIYTMNINEAKPTLSLQERFGEFSGSLSIENNGLVVKHSNIGNSPAIVRGTKEYSSGKHQIQVLITKKNVEYVMSFNITSKSIPLSRTLSNGRRIAYGWFTDDRINYPESDHRPKKGFKDFQNETVLKFQIIIDCDNRKIGYFNERTKNTGEMNVNIDLCPFPWQLEFYLFDTDDCIELLSAP